MLHRYWFTFRPSQAPSPLNLGCGVTAHNALEAERIIHDTVFPLFGEREIADVKKDIDVQSLERSHVRPNMGNPILQGVWFTLMG